MLKTAVIGLGVIGHVHMQVLRNMGHLPAAVCDNQPERLKEFSDIPGYTDYRLMLDEVQPDLIHICTPHYLHTEMILEGLRRNIHVLCEKPLCIRTEDVPLILAAEKVSRGQLGICFQNRYKACNRYVKEYLEGKTVQSGCGSVIWKRGRDYYAADAWRGKWATEGGGVLINQALHTLDLMIWYLGMPAEITAMTGNLTLRDEIEVEDSALLLCREADGRGFSFTATNGSTQGYPVEITLKADGHIIQIFKDKVLIDGELKDFRAGGAALGKEDYGNGHDPLIRDFYDCCETGRRFPIGAAEAQKAALTVLGAYRSQGRPEPLQIFE